MPEPSPVPSVRWIKAHCQEHVYIGPGSRFVGRPHGRSSHWAHVQLGHRPCCSTAHAPAFECMDLLLSDTLVAVIRQGCAPAGCETKEHGFKRVKQEDINAHKDKCSRLRLVGGTQRQVQQIVAVTQSA